MAPGIAGLGAGRPVPDPDDAHGRALLARELTVTFLGHLLAAMRKTVPGGGLAPGVPGRDVLDGAFDRALAEALARSDPLGFERRLGDPPGGGIPGQDGSRFGGRQPIERTEVESEDRRRVEPLPRGR